MRNIMILSVAALAALTALAKQSTAKEKFRKIKSGFPYETRVDRTTIPGKAIVWYSDGHSVTVTPRVVTSCVLTNTYEKALADEKKVANRMRKIEKDREKAAKEDQKNLEKAVKELEKLQEKTESEELKTLYQDAIDIFRGGGDEL